MEGIIIIHHLYVHTYSGVFYPTMQLTIISLIAAAGSSLFFTCFLFLLAPVFFAELCIVNLDLGSCPVRCRITGGHCAREVCEVRGIKMLTLEMTTCVRSILYIFYNFQTKIRIFG